MAAAESMHTDPVMCANLLMFLIDHSWRHAALDAARAALDAARALPDAARAELDTARRALPAAARA